MEEKLCKCGCGGVVKPGNTWINGHNRRGKTPHNKGIPMSEEQKNKSSESHKGKKMLPQTRAALLNANTGRVCKEFTREKIKISNTGLKRSPETCKNISEAKIKFYKEHPEAVQKIKETVQKFYDNMDAPGQQIVKHHYIYDHNDLTKYTTEMTRATHAKIHMAMRKEGIKIPHINIKD